MYDILELQKLTPTELHDLADTLGIDPEIKSKQGKIYAILNVQNPASSIQYQVSSIQNPVC